MIASTRVGAVSGTRRSMRPIAPSCGAAARASAGTTTASARTIAIAVLRVAVAVLVIPEVERGQLGEHDTGPHGDDRRADADPERGRRHRAVDTEGEPRRQHGVEQPGVAFDAPCR